MCCKNVKNISVTFSNFAKFATTFHIFSTQFITWTCWQMRCRNRATLCSRQLAKFENFVGVIQTHNPYFMCHLLRCCLHVVPKTVFYPNTSQGHVKCCGAKNLKLCQGYVKILLKCSTSVPYFPVGCSDEHIAKWEVQIENLMCKAVCRICDFVGSTE